MSHDFTATDPDTRARTLVVDLTRNSEGAFRAINSSLNDVIEAVEADLVLDGTERTFLELYSLLEDLEQITRQILISLAVLGKTPNPVTE